MCCGVLQCVTVCCGVFWCECVDRMEGIRLVKEDEGGQEEETAQKHRYTDIQT